MKRSRWQASWLTLSLLSGCGSLPPVQLCGEIPADGCPIGRGGTCDDATCAALYDCVEGDWTLVETCDSSVGGASASGGAGGGGDGGGSGGCVPFEFDHSNEAEGCPLLQEPDCPAEVAETCDDPCLTGCIEFLLCEDEDGNGGAEPGWVDVAFCDERLTLHIVQGTR